MSIGKRKKRESVALFGTLLGFGRDNAWEYVRQGGGEAMEKLFTLSLEQEKSIEVPMPTCAVISDTQETKNLRKSYEKQQPAINKIFHQKDFLEQVLMKLTGK